MQVLAARAPPRRRFEFSLGSPERALGVVRRGLAAGCGKFGPLWLYAAGGAELGTLCSHSASCGLANIKSVIE